MQHFSTRQPTVQRREGFISLTSQPKHRVRRLVSPALAIKDLQADPHASPCQVDIDNHVTGPNVISNNPVNHASHENARHEEASCEGPSTMR